MCVIRIVVALFATANVYWVKALELPKHFSTPISAEVIQRPVFVAVLLNLPIFPLELPVKLFCLAFQTLLESDNMFFVFFAYMFCLYGDFLCSLLVTWRIHRWMIHLFFFKWVNRMTFKHAYTWKIWLLSITRGN